ncbi:hypothetical protein PTTG_04966 [Puccinia triticina 1-1 BBBD Race 1]|uniref:Ras-GAP domain-containing protein n=1 Tax=Puccinia triticina (isolate 1-1 / race 1 (BBBD)) TaxID=630390 RepID=A0A180GJJ8_PUCT1|nr:hypothetical protein PTTG_04966 [Puccinia triticina 1-1 BBBD Race 1]
MVDLLVADDLRMREGVKDALGMELNTALFPILLKHLKSIVAHFFEHEQAKPQSPFSHFIEQAISMLRLFFKRINEPLAKPVAKRLAGLLVDFARYTNQLGSLGSDFSPFATRIKYKMAQLCELLVAHKDRPPLVNSPVLKSQLIGYFLAWATSIIIVHLHILTPLPFSFSDFCFALAAFYNRLKLRPRHALRNPPFTNPDVINVCLFSRHYDYLSFLLTEVTKLEAVAVCSRKGKMVAGGKIWGGLQQQDGGGGVLEQAAALQRKLASITRKIVKLAGFRKQTINCLVKLMAANINPAFRYFVNMFHYPDNRIKQANTHILWEVVKQGGHLLPELVKPVRATGLDKIMITRPDLTLALAICKVCGSANFKEVTEVILNIFDYCKGVIKFLKASIKREVATTSQRCSGGTCSPHSCSPSLPGPRATTMCRPRSRTCWLALPTSPWSPFNPHRASAEEDKAARNLEQVTEAFLNVIHY